MPMRARIEAQGTAQYCLHSYAEYPTKYDIGGPRGRGAAPLATPGSALHFVRVEENGMFEDRDIDGTVSVRYFLFSTAEGGKKYGLEGLLFFSGTVFGREGAFVAALTGMFGTAGPSTSRLMWRIKEDTVVGQLCGLSGSGTYAFNVPDAVSATTKRQPLMVGLDIALSLDESPGDGDGDGDGDSDRGGDGATRVGAAPK